VGARAPLRRVLHGDPRCLSASKLTLADIDWAAHEETYGSHYANAATFGHVKYLKTTLTTKTEAALVKEGIELKAQASAAFDGFTGGTNFDVKQTWGDKFTNTIEQEDLRECYVGEQAEPAAIFLDLRPANELLNPILLPWSADPLATTEEIQAPFLWYLLRQSWRDYQRRIHQIDASISTLPDKDWSPKIVRFHGEAKLAKTDEWEGWFEDRIYGRTKWRPYGTPLVAESVDYYSSAANSQGCLSGLIPGTEISCMLVADSTAAAGAGVALRALPRSHARLFATRTTRPDSTATPKTASSMFSSRSAPRCRTASRDAEPCTVRA
jgi:hypothetical protein